MKLKFYHETPLADFFSGLFGSSEKFELEERLFINLGELGLLDTLVGCLHVIQNQRLP